jgi:hypothetical protein
MPASNVIALSENVRQMSFADGLAFVERTRRQLTRFDAALPHAKGETIAPEDEADIRRLCDELEADIHRSLAQN